MRDHRSRVWRWWQVSMEGSRQVCESGFPRGREGQAPNRPGHRKHRPGTGQAGQTRAEASPGHTRRQGRPGRRRHERRPERQAGPGDQTVARAGTRPGQANQPPGKQETRRDPNPLVRGQWLVFAQHHGSVSLKRSRLCLCLRCGPLFAFLAWRSAQTSARSCSTCW